MKNYYAFLCLAVLLLAVIALFLFDNWVKKGVPIRVTTKNETIEINNPISREEKVVRVFPPWLVKIAVRL